MVPGMKAGDAGPWNEAPLGRNRAVPDPVRVHSRADAWAPEQWATDWLGLVR